MPVNYCDAIRHGFQFVLANYPEVFCIGQGLWSPWYVGNSMLELDREFGLERIIDTPVSEVGCTGAAIGAAIGGYRPIIVHPRMDFAILAMDPIVNTAAKWHHMLGGHSSVPVTIRMIVNRGGEQGAQHSQALHSWFAHIPGLQVVMPATVADARDLLIGAVLSNNPVVYIDDRWLYSQEAELPEAKPVALTDIKPQVLRQGADITLVGASHSVRLSLEAAELLRADGVSAEVVDLRIVNPLDVGPVAQSVRKTGRLLAVDGGWRTCGLAGEVIAGVVERLPISSWRARPARVTLPDAPAPASSALEAIYYHTAEDIRAAALAVVRGDHDAN